MAKDKLETPWLVCEAFEEVGLDWEAWQEVYGECDFGPEVSVELGGTETGFNRWAGCLA